METAFRIAREIGPIAAIALLLIWFLQSIVAARLEHIDTKLQTHTSQTEYYMRQICLNTATSGVQQLNCLALDQK